MLEVLFKQLLLGRPLAGPRGIPSDRLQALRAAFEATMTDADFAAEVRKSKLDLDPEDGAHLAALIAKIYATPKPIVDKITGLIK